MDASLDFESWLTQEGRLDFLDHLIPVSPVSDTQSSVTHQEEATSPSPLSGVVIIGTVGVSEDSTRSLADDSTRKPADDTGDTSGYASASFSLDFLSSPEGTPDHKGQSLKVTAETPPAESDTQQEGVSVTEPPPSSDEKDTPSPEQIETRNAKPSKPEVSYLEILARAIMAAPEQKMLLGDLYEHVDTKYPYFRSGECAWRNSVRHNLSVNECFMKSGRAPNGRGFYWAIHPACVDAFRAGDFNRRLARRRVTLANKATARRQQPKSACHMTEGHVSTGQMTAVQMTSGHMTPGHMTTGHMTAGHMATGHMTAGHMTTGHMTACHMTTGPMTAGHMTTAHPGTTNNYSPVYYGTHNNQGTYAISSPGSHLYGNRVPGNQFLELNQSPQFTGSENRTPSKPQPHSLSSDHEVRSIHDYRQRMEGVGSVPMTSTPIRHGDENIHPGYNVYDARYQGHQSGYSGYDAYSQALLARFRGSPLGNLYQLSMDNQQYASRHHTAYTTTNVTAVSLVPPPTASFTTHPNAVLGLNDQ